MKIFLYVKHGNPINICSVHPQVCQLALSPEYKINQPYSKVIMWVTVAWVILVSFPKSSDAGPVTFVLCLIEAAGPICAAQAAAGKIFL